MNLYQKYKPISFEEVTGHEKTVKELIKRSKEKNFPQAVHFTGITGIGKTVLAHIYIKSILCKEKEPCNKCDSCLAINEDKQLLSYYPFNASNLGIEQMREIEDIALKKNAFSNIKVIYIDEMQELNKSKSAQKNLLKILEKPLKNVYFVLSSMDDSKIDKAVLNRAITFKLKPLSMTDIAKRLKYICDKEGTDFNTEEKAAILISLAQNCQGSLRTAISLLERVLYSEIFTEKEMIEELGLATDDTIQKILQGILSGDITILSNKITEDILDALRFKLVLLYKVTSGFKLNSWEVSQLSKLEFDPAYAFTLENTVNTFLSFFNFTYLNQSIIDLKLIECINKNKELKPSVMRKLRS